MLVIARLGLYTFKILKDTAKLSIKKDVAVYSFTNNEE